jgi:hypothetical protein
VDPPGGVALSGAAVAAASAGVKQREEERARRGCGEQIPGTCVRMAGCEGVTRGERATGMP